MKPTAISLATLCGVALATVSQGAQELAPGPISPVTNPLYFEDPHINNEVRPIFAQHWMSKDFITDGGDAQFYAVQLRWAVTERFAIIATKDGYMNINPGNSGAEGGWANLGFGVKYALVDDRTNQFIVTPGVKLEVPTGSEDVYQGTGDGEWDIFVSAAKGWDRFHLTGSFGGRIPNNFTYQTAQLHYSLQVDYWTCRWFIPFVAANGYTVLSEGKGPALTTEGYDLINFGSSDAKGQTMITLGAGFRSRLLKDLDFGFAYEHGMTHPQGLFDDRLTFDVIWRW